MQVAPEANRKARKALRRAARTERAARAKPVAPVTDEPATATTRDVSLLTLPDPLACTTFAYA